MIPLNDLFVDPGRWSGGALLRRIVHFDQPKAGSEAVGPLKVIQKAPMAVANHRYPILYRVCEVGEAFLDKRGTP